MSAIAMNATTTAAATMRAPKSARVNSFKPVKAARSLTGGFAGRAQPLVARAAPKAAGRKMVVDTMAYKVRLHD